MSSAQARNTLVSVLANWNQPVSVATATKSVWAIFGDIFQSAYFRKSQTMSPAAAAVASMSSTSPSPSAVR